MAAETLHHVWSQFAQKVGRTALKNSPWAILVGAVTFFVAHREWRTAIEVPAIAAFIAAIAIFVWLLVLATGRLEKKLGEVTATAEIQNRRIGAHRAIAAWVDGCVASLGDEHSGLSREDCVSQELRQLETSSVNSLSSYSFYPASMAEKIHEVAAGKSGQTEEERLDELLVYLKKQLQAGAYLV